MICLLLYAIQCSGQHGFLHAATMTASHAATKNSPPSGGLDSCHPATWSLPGPGVNARPSVQKHSAPTPLHTATEEEAPNSRGGGPRPRRRSSSARSSLRSHGRQSGLTRYTTPTSWRRSASPWRGSIGRTLGDASSASAPAWVAPWRTTAHARAQHATWTVWIEAAPPRRGLLSCTGTARGPGEVPP